METFTLAHFQESADFIRRHTQIQFKTAIILGTGLGNLVDQVEVDAVLDYSDIPHFPLSTVETHSGKLIAGYLDKVPVLVMQGRFHYYEGYSMKQVTYPVRVMKLLGIENLFISNIAGGINAQFELADLMILEDHINLQPDNPLLGKNINEIGPRWPDMFEPYKRSWIDEALAFGQAQGYRIREGVYASVAGPNLETRAEYRYLAGIGADAVGMSTVPEVIVANHMGMKVFAISAISDLCYEPKLKPADITELLQAAADAQPKMTAIFRHLLGKV
ncbi:MAG: purine-nucleoside phosphorylase [Bacteroidetes bacterium]|nr:MAG: purine-nucleoside phosphorylase [Bacteroidota bacterium]